MSQLIQRLLAAFNDHDLEAAAALFHESYKSVQPVHPARAFVGRAQMHANWAAIFAGVPDFHAEVLRSADDGRPFDMRGVTIFEIEDGLITSGRLFMQELERGDVGIAEAVQTLTGRRPDRPTGPVD